MIKLLIKLGKEGSFLNLMKGILKSTTNILHKCERLNAFPLRLENSLSLILFNNVLKDRPSAKWKEKEMESI